jgi:pimeloyl-ACP methyl ester carboxylesterase
MVNYGGPGSITSEEVAQRYPAVLGDAVGEEIADRYDIVAVDWRGHGRSQPALRCGFVNDGNPSSRPSADPDNDEVWSAYVRSLGEVRASCLTSVPREMLARIGADDMARDMDRVRAVLGEEQITYVGYSYGAYLGAMYLTLFPNRVRAVVLDAPPAPLRTLRHALPRPGAGLSGRVGPLLRVVRLGQPVHPRGPGRRRRGGLSGLRRAGAVPRPRAALGGPPPRRR